MRHYIHRITDNEHHRIRVLKNNFANNATDDCRIFLQKLQARFARLLGGSCSNDNQLGVAIVRRIAFADRYCREKRLPMNQVQHLTACKLFIFIDEHNFVGFAALRKRVGKGCSNISRPDDDPLSAD